jgi:hypothetical protein
MAPHADVNTVKALLSKWSDSQLPSDELFADVVRVVVTLRQGVTEALDRQSRTDSGAELLSGIEEAVKATKRSLAAAWRYETGEAVPRLDNPTRHKSKLGLNDEDDAFWGRYKAAAGDGVPTEGMLWLRSANDE